MNINDHSMNTLGYICLSLPESAGHGLHVDLWWHIHLYCTVLCSYTHVNSMQEVLNERDEKFNAGGRKAADKCLSCQDCFLELSTGCSRLQLYVKQCNLTTGMQEGPVGHSSVPSINKVLYRSASLMDHADSQWLLSIYQVRLSITEAQGSLSGIYMTPQAACYLAIFLWTTDVQSTATYKTSLNDYLYSNFAIYIKEQRSATCCNYFYHSLGSLDGTWWRGRRLG